MKKIIISLAIALVAGLGVGIAVANAETINVPEDYSTIQEAIDAADDGDIIDVAAGTYTATSLASIVIDKPLTLQGAGMDNTIIDAGTFTGTSTCPAWNKGPRGIQIISDDVFIKDLTVQGFKGDDGATCGGYGILFRDIDGDSDFSGGGVENVKVKDCHEGIYALRFEDLVIKDNIVENSVGDGMFIARDSANAVIEENTVTNSGDQGIWVGTDWMAQGPSDNCQIKNNVVNGTREAGIIFAGSVDCLIEGNSVTNSQGEGWSFGAISIKDGSDDVTVTQNTVHNNPTLGIGIDGASGDILIEYNKIYENTGYGVQSLSSAVNAENNWWGDATGPKQATTSPCASGDGVSDNVDYTPWLDAAYPEGGKRNYNVVNITSSTTYNCIQSAIDAATTSDTINVAAGTYEEMINIDKSLTLLGATYDVPKNGYPVLVDYAWDDTVESIINHPNPSGGYTAIVDIVDVDNVTFKGFVVQELNAVGNLNASLLRVYAYTREISNVVVSNNVIGPNTNITAQDGAQGRMGLYIVNHPYSDQGVVNSTFSGNKIFHCLGNGNNVFLWSSYYEYGAPSPASMSGTVIEDNEIYGSHRSGIETAGGYSGLTIRNNEIYGQKHLAGEEDNLKYGNGILLIRGSSDKVGGPTTAYGPEDLTIENNEIYSNDKNGIYAGPINKNYTITGNDIHSNGWDGIRVDLDGNYWNPTFEPSPNDWSCYDGAENIDAHFNNIYDNAAGIQVIGTPTNGFVFNANNNWWDSKNGPTHSSNTYNINFQGDIVSDNVNFTPWLDALEGNSFSPVKIGEAGYPSIQSAIDAATTSDTINVAAGTYDEYVDIDKPLTLSGQPGAIVKPSTSPDEPIIGINADGVTVEGFEVDGMDLTVVWAGIGTWDGCTNVTIQDNIVHDILNDPAGNANSGLGIGLWRGGDGNIFEDILIEGNTIYNTDRMGIYVGALNSGYTQWLLSDNIRIRDNEVYDTMLDPNVGETFPGGCGGIAIDATKGSTVEGNTVYDTANTMPGIFLAHGSGPRNQISGNEVHDQAYGIAVDINRGDVDFGEDSPTAPEVHSNNIHDNGEYGLIVLNADEKVVDATNNWWGDETGPGGEGPGNGDQISESIDYSPWYTNQEMTSLAGTLVDNQLTMSTEVDIVVTTTVGDVTVEIPAGLTVTGEKGWTGEINAPEVKLISSVTVIPESGKTATVSVVIEIGYGDIKLTFDQAVRIAIADQADKYVGYSRAGVFTPITTICTADTQAAGNALPAEGDCKIDVGPDLVIWTKHFTKFVTYSQTTVPPPPSGGGGGTIALAGDTTAPSISEINVVAKSNAAIITWQTNEQSISWLVYGETTTYGEEVKTTTYITSHSVTLGNLNPSTAYHYQIKSKDSSGNIGTHTDRIFTTPALEEEITGDINDDGKVDIFDFNLLMVNWGDSPANLAADLDDNGRVDISDFNLLIVNWIK